MSIATKIACQCNCNPCACPPPTGSGCLPDSCPPRPCFFDGQLITADDMNAMMTYLRTKNALLTKLVSGWGVLGGMKVGGAPGIPYMPLVDDSMSNNPQILAGTTLQIGAGVAADVRGNLLSLCAPVIVDAKALADQDPSTPAVKACSDWFPNQEIDACADPSGAGAPSFTAADYLVVAQFRDTPTRPVPQFSGGGACDPAPSCDFSRKLEQVDIRLVPTNSVNINAYAVTGCLDEVELPFPIDIGTLSNTSPRLGENARKQCEAIDALNETLVNLCCENPAVVLGRVLLTSAPSDDLKAGLPLVPLYTIVQDFYPVRRVIAPNALFCLLEKAATPPPVVVA